MSRLEPLPLEELGELAGALDTFKERMGFIANSGRIMARRPRIVSALAGLARSIMSEGEVSVGTKSLIGQVASWASGCRYCQAHFANNILRAGIEVEKLENLWNYERSPLFSDAERAALNLAMSAARVPNEATDAQFEELKRYWTDGQIVEILATISYVAFLNSWNDTLATTLEPMPSGVAEKHLRGSQWHAGKHSP